MNELTEHQVRERYHRIPEPLSHIMHTNPAVHQVAQQFARGYIITLEECLCRMVVVLATDWKREHEKHMELIMASCGPLRYP